MLLGECTVTFTILYLLLTRVQTLVPGPRPEDKMEEQVVLIDTAISSEHAVVRMDEETGLFYITDGRPKRPSTNGTWLRLSGPYQPSPEYELPYGAEVLFGTVRFVARQSQTISEYAVDHSECSPVGATTAVADAK